MEVNDNVEFNFNMHNVCELIGNGDQNEQIEMHNVDITTLDFKNTVFKCSRALVATLYSSSTLSRAHVDEIIKLISELFSGNFMMMLRSKTLSLLRTIEQRDKNNEIQHLIEMFDIIEKLFEGLETERQRVNALKASQCYISPRTYIIGVSEKIKKIGNVPVLTPIVTSQVSG